MSEYHEKDQDNDTVSDNNEVPDLPEENKPKNKLKVPQEIVMVLVGKWAMPTTVILVLITCLSGYFLDVGAFTPVVGMIAPVVMALIMVIKEASVGKEEDEVLVDREREREERLKKYELETELRLAQLKSEEKRHQQDMNEKARQFDINSASTKEFVDLANKMNSQFAEFMKKETELVVGDTRVKVSDGGTKVAQTIDEKMGNNHNQSR